MFRRDDTFRKWRRFAEDSQTVLVYGMVPRHAVLASIPLLHILRKLPSYFLRKDVQLVDGNPLDQVAWNYTSRKLGYHQFCREVSTLFLNRPEDVKLRDSTAGAVRLALAFLRPFFHDIVQDDFDIALSYLRSLAISISEWPANGWVKSYPEVRQIVDSMVLALGEELRAKYALQQGAEITRLQLVIDGLEDSLKARRTEATALRVDDLEVDSDDDLDGEFGETDDPTLVAPDIVTKNESKGPGRRSSLKMTITVLPPIPVSFQTPITPPESPRNSLFFPTVTVPLSDMTSTKHSSKSMSEEPVQPSRSERPASPPLTPPPCVAVFSRPILLDEMSGALQERTVHPEGDLEAEILRKVVEETLEMEVLDQGEHLNVEVITEDDDDDDDKTEPGDDLPSSLWSSPRSSVFSVETLCDNNDVPFKRLSYGHTRSNSFDIFGRMSPPASSRASRTVSFSKSLSTALPFLLESSTDPVAISLPASPPGSIPSSPSLKPSRSYPLPHVSNDETKYLTPSIVLPKRSISLLSPLAGQDDDDTDTPNFRSTSVTENASYIVTGFLVGAFLTLFLFSTQRRTLLYVT